MQEHIDRLKLLQNGDTDWNRPQDAVLDVAVYVRVSITGQTTDNQLIELAEICEHNKWHITNVYNETVSGTKGVNQRPELKRMLDDATRNKFSMVVVWSCDRIARSLQHFVTVMTTLDDLGCDIFSFKQGIRTDTSMGSMFFSLMAVMSQMETDIRKERQTIGIRRALSQGVKFGRKDVVDEDTELRIVELRHKGKSIRYIAKDVGISVGRTHRVIKEWQPILSV